MKNMMTAIAAHNVENVSIRPVNRVESSAEELGYFYSQQIEVEGPEGERTTFGIYFSDAVGKRLENERLADERAAAQDQATAMEYLERKAEQNQLDL